ncbi:hypothetical protein [Dactylosporangium sp. NPDC048998]|uniref:hypothetical protein n=1 Tax=Dactylosporangium sp. NPDC048998 TaxID=3363976 RepID=UPI0037164CB4
MRDEADDEDEPVPAASTMDRPQGLGEHVVDGAVCVGLLAVTFVLATTIADRRTDYGLYAVADGLSWLHLGVAAAVVASYFVLGRWFLGGTFGQRRSRAAPRRGSAVQVAPVLWAAAVAVVAGAFLVGFTSDPWSSTAGPGAGAGAGPTSPVPTTDRPTGDPAQTRAGTLSPTLGGTPSPSGDPRGQAQAVDDLLARSKASRGSLGPALDRVCRDPGGAEGTIRQIASERATELDQAKALQTAALPRGTEVYTYLVAALSASLEADNAYLAWAQDARSGNCRANPHQADGDAVSRQATQAKRQFLDVWNPIAGTYGLRQWVESDI